MIPITDALIGEMVQAIVDEVDPEQVILFGSRARGEEGERSDVDLIVLEAEPFGPERSRHEELVRLYHALAGFPVAADVLVYSREDVDYWRDSLNHVLARALREGKVLADRGIDTTPFLDLSAYTPYAVEFRYAGVGPDAKPIDRAGALETVEALLERVGSQLPEGGGA